MEKMTIIHNQALKLIARLGGTQSPVLNNNVTSNKETLSTVVSTERVFTHFTFTALGGRY